MSYAAARLFGLLLLSSTMMVYARRNTRRQCSEFAGIRWKGKLDYYGHMLFRAITRHDPIDAIKQIITAYPQVVNARDVNGRTPLHWAALDGMVQVVELLLKMGAYIDVQDIRGNTSLHLAVANSSNLINRMNTITVLLDEGAAIVLRNAAGLNVFDVSQNFAVQDHLYDLARKRVELVETRQRRRRKITKLSNHAMTQEKE